MKKKKSIGKLKLQLPQQDDQSARLVKCDLKISEFILNVPKHHVKKHKENLHSLKLYAVHVLERNPPEGVDFIDWMLLYNLPIKNSKEALEKVKWYCIRWRIEVFHKILKSGLKVEACRLSTSDRLIRYLTLMSIVAWRIFWITLIARVSPNASCLIFLNNIEWKILFSKHNKNRNVPKNLPQ